MNGAKSTFFIRVERCSSRSRAASVSDFLHGDDRADIFQKINAAFVALAAVPLFVLA